MKDWYIGRKYCLTGNEKYSITLGYERLIRATEKWEYVKLLWIKYSIPKHYFTNWLVVHDRILTKE